MSASGQYGPGRHVFDYDIRGRTVLQSCNWSDTLGVIVKQGMYVPDLSQVDWAKVITLSFTVVPVVYRYRGVLAKITDVLAEAIGFSALVGGMYVYKQTLPEIPKAALQFKSDLYLSEVENVQYMERLCFFVIIHICRHRLLSVYGTVRQSLTR